VPDAATCKWLREQTLAGYARACQAILDCSDQRVRDAALRDWDHTREIVITAIAEYLTRTLRERQEAQDHLQ
jgi:hypothetical protein